MVPRVAGRGGWGVGADEAVVGPWAWGWARVGFATTDDGQPRARGACGVEGRGGAGGGGRVGVRGPGGGDVSGSGARVVGGVAPTCYAHRRGRATGSVGVLRPAASRSVTGPGATRAGGWRLGVRAGAKARACPGEEG